MLSFFSKDDLSFTVSRIALFLLFGQNCSVVRHTGARNLILLFQKLSKERKIESFSPFQHPIVTNLASVG